LYNFAPLSVVGINFDIDNQIIIKPLLSSGNKIVNYQFYTFNLFVLFLFENDDKNSNFYRNFLILYFFKRFMCKSNFNVFLFLIRGLSETISLSKSLIRGYIIFFLT